MEDRALIEKDILRYLDQHQRKELLRFTTVGSVDDGKSTLIGRLLYDAHGLYEDQLRAVERASGAKSNALDLSLVTDGLKAEREQGITIDVAYRYFSTDKRKFIIADTPGHVQYTRNMATGASTANVAVILIDARLGVLQQSRRHAYIASLLGIPHLTVCVNKMDLRGYAENAYAEIHRVFSEFCTRLRFRDVTFIPISALAGDNVVHPSGKMPWYRGPSLLSHLESLPIEHDRNLEDFRYPVQYVLRPHLDYRGFAGEIASGVVKKGDPVVVLPSRKATRIRAIDTFEGECETAFAPMSVTLRLEDEVDVSRGDMLVHPENLPEIGQRFEAMLVWMSERPLDREKSYILKHTTQTVRAEVTEILGHTDLESLEEVPAEGLSLNDIGRARIRCHRALYFDSYRKNRRTGAFILIDSISNNTVAAGMIIEAEASRGLRGQELGGKTQVSPTERRERLGQAGGVVWIAGRDPAAATELAYAIERRLFDDGRVATVIDVRTFDAEVPPQVVAERIAKAGVIAIVAAGGTRPDNLGETALVEVDASSSTADVDSAVVPVSGDAESAAARVVGALERRNVFG